MGNVKVYALPRELHNRFTINPHDLHFSGKQNFLTKQVEMDFDHQFDEFAPKNIKTKEEAFGNVLTLGSVHIAGYYLTDVIHYFKDLNTEAVYLRIIARKDDTPAQILFYKCPGVIGELAEFDSETEH